MIEIEQLWERIDAVVSPLASEEIPTLEAVGRQLVKAPPSRIDFPPFDHSAMDGYAFAEARPGSCMIVEEIAAGQSPHVPLVPGTAARIMTGAPVPEGTFAVAMQEVCSATGGRVSLVSDDVITAGAHVRSRGSIAQAGTPILAAGQTIRPGTVALLAACGVDTVSVHRRPVVTHIATGSELLVPGEALTLGKIHDSNGPMIAALLARMGITVERRRLADDAGRLLDEVRSFTGDLLLISGGSGPGDHDHSRSALEAGGFTVLSDRVNSRPGKPLLLATRASQLAFGLPGNPLSHWVCFEAFVRRALDKLEGRAPRSLVETHCPSWHPEGGDGRRTWTPAAIGIRAGRAEATPLPWRHSGDLSPLLAADALLLDAPDPASQLVRTLLL